ncbi:MAG: SulP family inorganic anion transporter, partial [Mangrovicoccus sp.]
GIVLLVLGLFQLGFLANFLSHPVIAGFITASGILIAFSQLKHILGIKTSGHNLTELVTELIHGLPDTNFWTLGIGVFGVGFLYWSRSGLKPLLMKAGLSAKMAGIFAKTGPVLAVIATTLFVWVFRLDQAGVAIVGDIPRGFPSLGIPAFDWEIWSQLLPAAIMISVIGFVESVSVAQTFAARRRQRIDPNQELIALGASNLSASVAGGLPVTGGFSRSVVNFDAGAETPAAGAFTAVGIGLAVLFLTPLIYFLPKATLAATIIVAVMSLVDFSILKKTWNYAFADFASVAATIMVTLGFGVEAGVSVGVAVSIGLFLFKTARPHVAEVGLVPGTEHFRNIRRHEVGVDRHVVTIRIDESLYFANARYLEDYIYDRVVCDEPIHHVILMCSAVNEVDLSALESLEAINHRLKEMGITLHLSEVKGPVMDRLKRTHFLEELTGDVHLSQFAAIQSICSPASQAAQ